MLITKEILDYNEYLLTDHWQENRTREIDNCGGRCRLCNYEGNLHVHHRTYERIGAELPDDVIALCGECHAIFHDKLEARKRYCFKKQAKEKIQEIMRIDPEICNLWATIACSLVERSQPVGFVRGRLSVNVTDSVIQHQLTFYMKEYKDKINLMLGMFLVRDIIFRVGKVDSNWIVKLTIEMSDKYSHCSNSDDTWNHITQLLMEKYKRSRGKPIIESLVSRR